MADLKIQPDELPVLAGALDGSEIVMVWKDGVLYQTDAATAGAAGFVARYELGVWLPGRIADGAVLYRYQFTQEVSWPLNLVGSNFSAGDTATASAEFSILKNSVEIGTITFAIGNPIPTVAIPATDWEEDDLLEIVAPSPRDDTLADINMTILGTRNV